MTTPAYPTLPPVASEPKLKFEEFIKKYLNDSGKFQYMLLIIWAMPCIIPSLNLMSWTLATSEHVQFTCKSGGNESVLTDTAKNCHCEDGRVYLTDDVSFRAVSQFDLVCERHYLIALVQSSYYLGQMIGSIALALLSDGYGRLTAFRATAIIAIYAGTWMMVPLGVYSYMLGRIILGFCHYGLFSIPVVLAMEFMSPSLRKFATLGAGCFFSVGQMILGGFALLRWKFLHFQLLIYFPALLTIVPLLLGFESPRWLLYQKRYNEVLKVFQGMAKWNQKKVPSDWLNIIHLPEEKHAQNKASPLELFTDPHIRKRTLVIMALWPVVSMMYYGMSTKMDLFGGDLYLNFILGAFFEIPANLTLIFVIDRSRNLTTVITLVLSSLCIGSNYFITDSVPAVVAILQMLLARGFITMTYASIYTYTPELFPTALRTSAVGLASCFARIGGIFASFLALHLVRLYGKEVVIFPFASLGLLAATLVFFTLPETAGSTLLETIRDVDESDEPVPVDRHELRPLRENDIENQNSHHKPKPE